jgi:Calcineurin-like phosphoesterase
MNSKNFRRALSASVLAIASLAGAGIAGAQASDPVIFSFATVGDSRTDPGKPDATTLLANPAPTTEGGIPSLTGTILPQDNEWVTNTAAFATILSGIQAQDPNLLFFNGDMIFGYGRPTLPTAWANGKPNSWTTAQTVSPDTVFEIAQYAYWRGMVANLFQTGTYVIPVPGNHETQCSYSAEPYSASNPNLACNNATVGNLTGKTAYADNENMFRFNMGDLVQDLVSNIRFSNVSGYFATSVGGVTGTAEAAPVASANNGPISSSQTGLSYSFDILAQPGLLLHFVVINTDPAGADSTAPADWLASDLAAAKARGAAKYFVFGHKPAFTYNYAAATGGSVQPPLTNSPGPGGLDANYVTVGTCPACTYTQPYRNAFWSVITQYGATYFSGHEHTVNVSKNPDPTGTYPGAPYQVIVGSGGSPFDDKLVGTCSASNPPGCTEPTLTNPYDRYYAWALVQVHASGNVSLQVNGFSDGYGATTTGFGPVQDLSIYDVATLQ